MYFLQMLPIFGAIAYYDWSNKRNIPEWTVALAWLLYSVSFLFFPFSDIVILLLMLAMPMFGLGMFWSLHLAIEYVYSKRIIPRNIAKHFRYGNADFFILPLMFAVMLQLGIGYIILWAVWMFVWANIWFSGLNPSDKRHGIPILTFSFACMVQCMLLFMLVK